MISTYKSKRKKKSCYTYSKWIFRIIAAIDFFFFFFNLLLISGMLNVPLDIKSFARICIDFQVTQQDIAGLVY